MVGRTAVRSRDLEFRRSNQPRTCQQEPVKNIMGKDDWKMMFFRTKFLFVAQRGPDRGTSSFRCRSDRRYASRTSSEDLKSSIASNFRTSSSRFVCVELSLIWIWFSCQWLAPKQGASQVDLVRSEAPFCHCHTSLSLQQEEVVVELVFQARNRKDANPLSQKFQIFSASLPGNLLARWSQCISTRTTQC